MPYFYQQQLAATPIAKTPQPRTTGFSSEQPATSPPPMQGQSVPLTTQPANPLPPTAQPETQQPVRAAW